MKKALLICILSAAALICGAQSNPDALKNFADTGKHKNKLKVAFLGTAGVNIQHFIGGAFADSLASKTGQIRPTVYNMYILANTYSSWCSNNVVAPYVAAGIDVRGGNVKWVDNIFGITYARFSGQYSCNTHVQGYTGFMGYSDYDNVEGSYSNNVFALQYALQFTAKYLYGSLGMKLDFNFVKSTQQVTATDTTYGGGDYSPPYSYGSTTVTNEAKNMFYISVPFQITAGGIVRVKKLEFRIGGYYNLYGGQGYSSMGLTLTVLHIPKGF